MKINTQCAWKKNELTVHYEAGVTYKVACKSNCKHLAIPAADHILHILFVLVLVLCLSSQCFFSFILFTLSTFRLYYCIYRHWFTLLFVITLSCFPCSMFLLSIMFSLGYSYDVFTGYNTHTDKKTHNHSHSTLVPHLLIHTQITFFLMSSISQSTDEAGKCPVQVASC